MNKTEQLLMALDEAPMVPVFYHSDESVALQVMESAYQAGVRMFEFTNRGPEAVKVFMHLKKHSHQFPGLLLAIGTITADSQAEIYLDLGADVIVSPIMRPSTAALCLPYGVPWVPGCGTLTEGVMAWDNGAPLLKLFPGSVLGPSFVSAVRPVVPHIRFMPTGGVEPTAQSLGAWFSAGVFCVGMGSQLIPKEMLDSGDFEGLTARISSALQLAKAQKIKASK
jgi:2-dehydro-3-deoxyphosphogluconate aldolase / (4S)-4-hydroxy-2-oxoglutarate aldolase